MVLDVFPGERDEVRTNTESRLLLGQCIRAAHAHVLRDTASGYLSAGERNKELQ